jgi:hypothetical protein
MLRQAIAEIPRTQNTRAPDPERDYNSDSFEDEDPRKKPEQPLAHHKKYEEDDVK